jgi:hypothetical protein
MLLLRDGDEGTKQAELHVSLPALVRHRLSLLQYPRPPSIDRTRAAQRTAAIGYGDHHLASGRAHVPAVAEVAPGLIIGQGDSVSEIATSNTWRHGNGHTVETCSPSSAVPGHDSSYSISLAMTTGSQGLRSRDPRRTVARTRGLTSICLSA